MTREDLPFHILKRKEIKSSYSNGLVFIANMSLWKAKHSALMLTKKSTIYWIADYSTISP